MTPRPYVLVVDDDAGTRETLADVLEARGYTVAIADRAESGLAQAATGSPDAAIVDIRLPDVSGFDLLQALKTRSPRTEVIFITGHASLPTAIQAIDGAAFAYLVKPFQMEHLLVVLEKALERNRMARALQETTHALEAVVDSSPLAIWSLDSQGIVRMWNTAAEAIFGWRREEVIGQPLPTIPPDKVDEARAVLRRALQGETVVNLETQRQRRDGSRVEVSLSSAPLRAADGSILGVSITLADITERKRAEEALRRSEASFRLLFADNPLPMWVYDLETLTFLEVNRAALDKYGYSRDEFLRLRLTDVRPPEDLPRLMTFLAAAPETGGYDAGEWRHRLKDGTIIDVRIQSRMMYLGDRHVGLGVVEDITDRKRAEAAHRESRQALEAVIQSSAAAIIALDLQGNVTRWNPSAERLLGWTEAEVLGRPLPIVPPAEAEEFHAHRARWFQGGISTDAEVRPLRKDGSTVHVSLSVAPLRDATGQVVGAIGNLIDITERNRLQEQLRQAQRLDAIGSLAGGIAHDFNNLLTVIGARAHIAALRLPAGAPAGQELALITQTTEQAARLTRQLLAFSRKQVLEPRVLDLGQVVGEMHRMLRRLIGEHIELVTESDPALWPALADPSQIEQVIMNLAVNARDAMPDGGRLTIATRNVELDEAYARAHVDVAPGAFVMLAVTDTGHGMDPDVQARIFEPFFTTKAPGQGTGLGLATVYGIVKQSGGHIAVVSEIGVGSSFKVYLPRTTEATAPAEAAALDLAEPGGTETVLLVEDDAALRDLVRQTLTRSGYAVLEAPHPEEALRTLETYRGQIDLLFTDVVMPGMNGRVLADRARALRHGLKVLFMSGYPATAISGQPILDPATDFLPKPFMPPTLIRKVREALDSRS